jgi:hypothetical protein
MRFIDWAVLLGGVILLLQLLGMVAELLVYLVMSRWYYLSGPTIVRHRWQTRMTPRMTPGEAVAAVEGALGGAKLAWRRYDTTFAIRRPWWEMSAYPRITLTIEAAPEGSALVVRVMPFVSGALFLYPAFIGIPKLLGFSLFLLGLCAAMYGYFFFWEMRRLPAIDRLREGLRKAGVRACGRCGYDLYGLAAGSACPECGAAAT